MRIVRASFAIGCVFRLESVFVIQALHNGTHSIIPDEQLQILHRSIFSRLKDIRLGLRVGDQVLCRCCGMRVLP